MREGVLYGSLAMLIGLRMLMLTRSWRLPSTLVPGKFFGLPLEDSTRRALLQKYRLLTLIAYAVELPIALGIWSWSGLKGLLIEQFVSLVVFRVYHSLVGVQVIRQAKQAAESESWKPVRSVALFLNTRRLRDFADLRFEVGLPLFTLALFSFLIFQLSRAIDAPTSLLVERAAAFGVLAIYLQLGGLLIKQSLVKWRWRVPGKRIEEYQAWREAVLRYWLWVCDYFRCILTVALLSFVAQDLLSETEVSDRTILSIRLGVAGLIVGAGIVGLGRQQKRLRTLWRSLTPIEDFSLPQEPIAKAGFCLGGLGYWNADNPALFVPGPLVYALNLANRRSYLFAAYVTILIPLAIWCGCSQRAHGADDMTRSRSEGTNSSRAEDHQISARALQQVDRSVQQLIDDDEAVGAEVLILQHGRVLLHKAYGWSDLDRQTPLIPNTIACIRSMTKPLVGTAIQMLIDEGKFLRPKLDRGKIRERLLLSEAAID